MTAFVFIVIVVAGALAQARGEVNGWPWYRSVPTGVTVGLLSGLLAYFLIGVVL